MHQDYPDVSSPSGIPFLPTAWQLSITVICCDVGYMRIDVCVMAIVIMDRFRGAQPAAPSPWSAVEFENA